MTNQSENFREPVEEVLPIRQTAPIIVNSPHSGRYYPQSFLQSSRLSNISIRKSEDFLVDELAASAVNHGIPILNAVYPRAYLDVNREPFELDPAMFDGKLPDHINSHSIRVSSGLGTIARIVSEGENIYSGRLPAKEALERISRIYRPYHMHLQNLIARTHVEFGCAVLLDMHSMPSSSMANERENRADFILGDRFGNSCSARILHHTRSILCDLGYRVEINKPYAGGFITQHYGRPLNGLHALQIEINRSLYMDEIRIRKNSNFASLAENLNTFFKIFSSIDLSGLEGSQPLAAE